MSRSRSYTSSRTEKELLCCLPILFIYLITPFPTIFGSDWLTWLQLNPSFLDYETTNLCQISVSHKRAELIPSMSKLNQNWAGAVPISQLSIWNSVGCVRAARCGGRTEYEQQLLWKSRVLFCFNVGVAGSCTGGREATLLVRGLFTRYLEPGIQCALCTQPQ